MIKAIRLLGGSLWMSDQRVFGDGEPNLLTAPEFAGGLTDAPTRGGLLTLVSLAGYNNAIAFGRDGSTTSYAYKTFSHTTGLTYVFSVLCKMDDGNAPSFAATNDGTIGANSFAIVIGGAVINPTLLTSQLQADGTYRVSGAWLATGSTNNMGVIKYTTNDARTFKVTGYKLEPGTVATPYTPQSVLRARGAYTDIAGTTPVTAVADLLGLLTDRSYGSANLGPNLVTNGDFSAGTAGWTVPAGWAIGSGAMVATSTSASFRQSDSPSVVGHSYEVEFDWTHVGGTLYVRVGAGTAATFTSSGRKRVILVAASTAGVEFYGGAVSGSLDNITSCEVLGSHATQSAVASKPTVQRINGRNVISFDGSNDFLQTGISTGNEGWVCAGVTLGTTGIGHHLFGNGGASATDVGVWLRVASTNNTATLLVSNGTTREITSAVTSTLTGAPKVIDGGWGAATMFAAVDGVETSIAKTVNCTTSKTCQIGGSNSVGWYTNGTMHAEVYTPVLPDAATRKIIRDGIAALQGRGPL